MTFLRLILVITIASVATACTGAPARTASKPKLVLPEGFAGVALLRAPAHGAPAFERVAPEGVEEGGANAAVLRYPIGSISKFITSIMALQLVDEGVLTLDDPIARWLPELSAATGRVSLRHLLSNRSGIPDGVVSAFRKDAAIAGSTLTPRETVARYLQGAPERAPGSQWDYALSNWVMVAAVLEAASGKDYAQLLQERLIVPLKLDGTGIAGSHFERTPGVAMGYLDVDGALVPQSVPVPGFSVASGTIVSTPEDLCAIADALRARPLVSAESLTELFRVHVPEEDYALGGRVIQHAAWPDKPLWWETGKTGAYRALLAYEPDSRTCLVMLNNTGLAQAAIRVAAEATLDQLRAPGAERAR